MSLILDALNRSQRDHDNLETVPGLETIHPVEAMSGSNRIGVGMLILLGGLAVVTAIWLFTSMRGTTGAEETSTSASVVRTPSIGPESRMPPKFEVPQAAAFNEPASVRSVDGGSKQASVLGAPAVETAQNSAVTALYQTPKPQSRQTNAKAVVPATQTKNINVDEILGRAKAGLKTVQLQDHSAPFIAELSQQVKDSIPTIYYSIHDYSSEKTRSYAVLNGTRVIAGQSFGGKFHVDEILLDSIVLTMGGIQFRLKALNSWVNL